MQGMHLFVFFSQVTYTVIIFDGVYTVSIIVYIEVPCTHFVLNSNTVYNYGKGCGRVNMEEGVLICVYIMPHFSKLFPRPM